MLRFDKLQSCARRRSPIAFFISDVYASVHIHGRHCVKQGIRGRLMPPGVMKCSHNLDWQIMHA
jgi:hypothetical protein